MIGWEGYCRPSRDNPHARDIGHEFVVGRLRIPDEFIAMIFVAGFVAGVLVLGIFLALLIGGAFKVS